MDLDGIAIFVKVVQAGSFTGAARLLGVPNTTVSAKVARLEKRLGVTLIQRTTRKLHITPAGRAYFERCVRGLEEIESAEAEVSLAADEPRGLLRITAPGDVAQAMLPPIVSRFLHRYPHTRVEVLVANRVVDLVAEGVHLAIRAAALRDSSLVARRIRPFSAGLWASRPYLQRKGTPKTPSELAEHTILLFPRFSTRLLVSHGDRDISPASRMRCTFATLDFTGTAGCARWRGAQRLAAAGSVLWSSRVGCSWGGSAMKASEARARSAAASRPALSARS